jgi:hypothetical protein
VSREWLERSDLSVFVVSGVPSSFERDLRKKLEDDYGEDASVMRLKGTLEEWVLSRVRGEHRRERTRTPATKALWRAFRALAAAIHHMRHEPEKEHEIRVIRDRVEELWNEAQPALPDQ